LHRAVDAFHFHVFHGQSNVLGIGGAGLLDCLGQQGDGGIGLQPGQVIVVLLLEAVDVLAAPVALVVDVADADVLHAIKPAFAHGRGGALKDGVIGVKVGVQARGVGGADQQREVRPPVAGDDGVGPRSNDLGDIGRDVVHFADGVQVV